MANRLLFFALFPLALCPSVVLILLSFTLIAIRKSLGVSSRNPRAPSKQYRSAAVVSAHGSAADFDLVIVG